MTAEWHARRDAVRKAIVENLSRLADDLDRFEQTTHVRSWHGEDVTDVAVCLSDAWEDPTAYRLSSLAQAIRVLQKRIV